ncbi:MAG: CapA family protein [Clostridia bacterium]|nr:CapA family protein [Clostridia bacterium]
MKLKDKYTIFIKNQKPISLLMTSCLIIATIWALVLVNMYVVNIKKTDYTYTPVMENASYRATFVGDVMLGRSVQEVGKKYGYNSLFKNVSYLWQNSNTVMCNMESVIVDNVKDYTLIDKTSNIHTNSSCVDSLKEAGFNLISLANNHITNYGEDGLKNTLNVLKQKGLEYIGAGENLEEASKYSIKEVNGLKVATISISDKIYDDETAANEKGGALTTVYSEYPLLINKAKTEANIVIVYIHWGESYTHIVTSEQEELAKNLINSGADIVIGAHQHTLQSVEKYNNGIILHGIGNLVFDQGWDFTKESVVANLSINANGDYAFELIPIYIEGATPEVTTDFYHVNRIFNTLTKKLNSTDYKIEDNKLIIEGNIQINQNNEGV